MADVDTKQAPSRAASSGIPPSEIDWAHLPPKSREILRHIAIPISLGFSASEVASSITASATTMPHLRAYTSTMTPSRVNRLMCELRRDLSK